MNPTPGGAPSDPFASSTCDLDPSLIRAQQLSTRLIFLLVGFGTAAWAPLVPFAKARARLDDGTLGLLLLCLGAGSIVAMPLAGALAGRFGCRAVIVSSVFVFAAALPFLAALSTMGGLVATLLIFGAGVGCADVSMNVQAVIVEKASGRAMKGPDAAANAGPNPHMEEWYAKGGLEFLRQVVDGRMGNIDSVRDDVPHILGRPALRLREWARQRSDKLIALAARDR